jgi:hypothetical protein
MSKYTPARICWRALLFVILASARRSCQEATGVSKYNPIRIAWRTLLFVWALIESPWKKQTRPGPPDDPYRHRIEPSKPWPRR